jgi:hypothetical protein
LVRIIIAVSRIQGEDHGQILVVGLLRCGDFFTVAISIGVNITKLAGRGASHDRDGDCAGAAEIVENDATKRNV